MTSRWFPGYRDRAPGQPRVPGAGCVPQRADRTALPGHVGGDRLAHDDGQRPRRARLGRGWDRGRGRDAGPTAVDADPAGRRVRAARRAARGRDGDGPGADGHPDAAPARGWSGSFVEFFGAGLAGLPLADRATIGNMSPEFGSTCAIFPIDAETLRYLEFRAGQGRQIELVEAYAREQGLWHDANSERTDVLRHAGARSRRCRPSIAGPKRPAGPGGVERGAGGVPPRARRVCPPITTRATRPRPRVFPSSDRRQRERPPGLNDGGPATRNEGAGSGSATAQAAEPGSRGTAIAERGSVAAAPGAPWL